ncbi:MAG: UDP-N-acetylglucosamine 2-epimerase [Bacillota bacterium]
MKKICIVTATRAEYGLLRPLMYRLQESGGIRMQLLVTGTHIEKAYGETVQEIIQDDFSPDFCIPIIADDSPLGILKTMGNAVQNVGGALEKLKPDLLLLLGDRYETLAIASAAVVLGIPVAHLYGGEVTYGAYDEMFRHAITKMSHLHFTATEVYRERVIQMGESPYRVFNVGALGVENVLNMRLLSKEDLEQQIGFSMDGTLLATFHSVTMETASQAEQFRALLNALKDQTEFRVLFTRPNADTYCNELNLMLNNFAANYPQRVKIIDSLGTRRYLSAMRYSACVIGNSSSGIIEAPSMRVGTINIGNRQKGRICAESIIHCRAETGEIADALNKVNSTDYQEMLQQIKNPYEFNGTSAEIIKQIKLFLHNNTGSYKSFYDL